jgi:hypothetical protein
MDWMSNVMVKKVKIWTQLVPFCQLGHLQLKCCHTTTTGSILSEMCLNFVKYCSEFCQKTDRICQKTVRILLKMC